MEDFPHAIQLPTSLFKDNKTRFMKMFKDNAKDVTNSILIFKGVETLMIDSTDIEYEQKQESFFYYLFGVQEADFYGIIDVDSEEAIIFAPEIPPIYKVFMTVLDNEDISKKYDIKTLSLNTLEAWVKERKPSKIFRNKGINTDSGNESIYPIFEWLKEYIMEDESLYPWLSESRAIKSKEEIEIMRWANKSASEGHIEVMIACKPGMREAVLQSKFRAYGFEKYNVKTTPYQNIVASGTGPCTLHYIDNNRIIQDNEMILLDLGHEILGYDSDITTTIPSNGKFTQKQKAVIDVLKPGVIYEDMHLLTERILIEELKKLGIIKGGDTEELLNKRISALFMPHGLGHLIGLDTHDVAGYQSWDLLRPKRAGISKLRCNRKMLPGFVLTVEPGCYFIEFLLEKGGHKFFTNMDHDVIDMVDVEKVREYRKEVGGVRIEENIVISETGCYNLTTVPRTVEEIEKCMAGLPWQ